MKIALTGHTSGIGKALYERLSRTHDVLGLSRTTGHDIRRPQRIIQAARDCDVFINNAHQGWSQADLFLALHTDWRDLPRLIVNVGSISPDTSWGRYAAEKAALDHLGRTAPGVCRVTTIRLGYVDTPRVAHVEAAKLDPSYVAEVIGWVIEQPAHVREITITPA